MAESIFINYRRDDAMAAAGRLHDKLAQAFGRRKLFMDIDHIPAGVDFANYLERQVADCDVFLAVIGPDWLDSRDASGRRRLDNPEDFVRIEIAAALNRDIRVIPVLIDGARMPTAQELPQALKPLARRNAVEVRNAQFGRDADALVQKVREALKGDTEPARSGRRWGWVGASLVSVLTLVFAIYIARVSLYSPQTTPSPTIPKAETVTPLKESARRDENEGPFARPKVGDQRGDQVSKPAETLVVHKIITGAERLASDHFSDLKGKRIGIITNQTGMVGGEHLVDVLHRAKNVKLAAILVPEHGFLGRISAGEKVGTKLDKVTGVPIHSLYGETRKPTSQMLNNIDLLIFDIQDVGTRFYTYISTMGLARLSHRN